MEVVNGGAVLGGTTVFNTFSLFTLILFQVSSYCDNTSSLPQMGSMPVKNCFNFSYYDEVTKAGVDNQGIVFVTKEG